MHITKFDQMEFKLLNMEDFTDPKNVLICFFEYLHFPETKEMFNMVKQKLKNADDDTYYFLERLEKLTEACYLLK